MSFEINAHYGTFVGLSDGNFFSKGGVQRCEVVKEYFSGQLQ